MLASIHPLGEQGRRQRWGVTVSAFVIGTVTGAALVGAALGLVGSELGLPGRPSPLATGLLILALAVLGAGLDLRVGGLSVPTVGRQVNEQWLGLYRGWVYGASFGFQLGLGVVTVVSTFTVYLALVLAALTGSLLGGLAGGATFGLVRGATVLAAADVREPQQLHRLHRRLQAWDGATRRLAVAAQGLVALGMVAALVGR